LNLTDLRAFAELMAVSLINDRHSYAIGTWSRPKLEWAELKTVPPDELEHGWVQVVAPGDQGAPAAVVAQLSLGGNRAVTQLSSSSHATMSKLESVARRWPTLGRRRQRCTWLYPVLLVLLLAAMLLPLIDAWVSGALTLAVVPLVVVVTCLACVGGAAGIRWLVARGAQRRMGLDIDFRMLEEVRRDRATVRLAIWSGVGGAVAGAVLGAVATMLAAR
jgi:hypothetical protein